jgi:hypothetical protein
MPRQMPKDGIRITIRAAASVGAQSAAARKNKDLGGFVGLPRHDRKQARQSAMTRSIACKTSDPIFAQIRLHFIEP